VSHVSRAVEDLLRSGARTAVRYVSDRAVVRATHRHRPTRRARTVELVLTIGQPNAREREFIRRCRKAGEPLPVRKTQLRHWPKKRK
jgi:hypothetical protein